jgi:integrase
VIESARTLTSDDWIDFKVDYQRDHLATQSKSYRAVFKSAALAFEKVANPQRITDATPRALAKFRTSLREQGKSAATIASYLRTLRAAFYWAHRHGLIEKPIHVEMPRLVNRGEKMKGRPITSEEFERMQSAAVHVVGEQHATALQRAMTGLWLSGLRLGESLRLSWDDPRDIMIINIDGRRPLVQIPASVDKGRIERMLPLTPDFVEWLRTLDDRVGRVYQVRSKAGNCVRTANEVGRLISEAGRRAGVVVGNHHATAHDFRRSFGERWSRRVTPAVLKELMRHRDIKTTLTYYVGENAERTANEVWEAVS